MIYIFGCNYRFFFLFKYYSCVWISRALFVWVWVCVTDMCGHFEEENLKHGVKRACNNVGVWFNGKINSQTHLHIQNTTTETNTFCSTYRTHSQTHTSSTSNCHYKLPDNGVVFPFALRMYAARFASHTYRKSAWNWGYRSKISVRPFENL